MSGERIARILRGEHKPIYYPGGKINFYFDKMFF